jgi:hypothetical protein
MSGYFDRGAGAGGKDEGYFNRQDVTGPEGVGSATGGPGGVAHENPSQGLPAQQGVSEKDGISYDPERPYIAHAVPTEPETGLDETAGTTSTVRADQSNQSIIEGSDSESTGTSWGLPAVEDATPGASGKSSGQQGQGAERAASRNMADTPTKDELKDVGAWSTMGTGNSAGSPTGNS